MNEDELERVKWQMEQAAKAALRPQNLTCPTCKRENALAPWEAAKGYQCGRCADLEEGCF
jgi:hypothetical protein